MIILKKVKVKVNYLLINMKYKTCFFFLKIIIEKFIIMLKIIVNRSNLIYIL